MLPSVFLVTPRKNSGLIPWNIPLKLFMWWTQHQSPNLYIPHHRLHHWGGTLLHPEPHAGVRCAAHDTISKPMNHFHSNCIQCISYIYESLTEHDTKHSWCNCRKILWQLTYDIFQQQVACWGKRLRGWVNSFAKPLSWAAFPHQHITTWRILKSWLVI